MREMKSYAERVAVGKPAVAAAFPFSLRIDGRLSPEEREKLLDVLYRHPMGIGERDLEVQFESGKLLLPRISEYAAVLVVQALRGAPVSMRLGPSDGIYSTSDTRSNDDDPILTSRELSLAVGTAAQGVAEHIPITPASSLPGLPRYLVLDVVTASAALKTQVVEAQSSTEYQEILEALQRELKNKAYRKGATAILNFSVQLTSLSLPTHYRITVVGSAVRAPSGDAGASPVT
jgi:uncharacterized protein YbjQ (UPF0145 family)